MGRPWDDRVRGVSALGVGVSGAVTYDFPFLSEPAFRVSVKKIQEQ